jgi:hypothetical protein
LSAGSMLHLASEPSFQIVAAADPFTVHKNLRGGVDVLLGLERVGLFTGGEDSVIYSEAGALEQLFSAKAEGAGVVRQDHSEEDGGLLRSHDGDLRTG